MHESAKVNSTSENMQYEHFQKSNDAFHHTNLHLPVFPLDFCTAKGLLCVCNVCVQWNTIRPVLHFIVCPK